ncbi:unnamed protein product [Jaminaea pallidilutea]
MHSHHSHSGQFCSHGHPGSTLEGMLQKAQQLGFNTYGLSEHVPRQFDSELYPEEREEGTDPDNLLRKFQDYLVEARRLQSIYAKGKAPMKVLVGAETENLSRDTVAWLKAEAFRTDESTTQKDGACIAKGVVDYLVGSVHHVGAFPSSNPCLKDLEPSKTAIPIDFDAATFQRALQHFKSDRFDDQAAHLRLCISYFESVYALVDAFRPEVIGHLDLCRLFRPATMIFESDGVSRETDPQYSQLQSQAADSCEAVIRLAVSYGALFEINTASVRKGWATPYPAPDVLRRILDLGGRVCLSDDAHGPSHVAVSYTEARQYLVDIGVKMLWKLEVGGGGDDSKGSDGAPVTFARGTRAVPVTNWEDDVFWTQLEKRRETS